MKYNFFCYYIEIFKFQFFHSTLICNEELGKDKVRDHCHLSGKFRGVAYDGCNQKYKVPKFSQLYYTICLAMIATYLLKHWEIAKEIFLAYEITKKTNFVYETGHR